MSRWKVISLDYIRYIDGRPHQHIGLPDDLPKWLAWKPGAPYGSFPTHAEAITYAQEHAKTQALKETS